MTEPMTIHDLATEMQTWLTFTPEMLEKAREANINTANSPALRKLVRDWQYGKYDEDPEYVGRWIEAILNKEG
jgi:hypothetical protein